MTDSLCRRVYASLPPEAWPPPDRALVIGLSGGPDSVALAHILDELNQTRHLRWTLHVAHLNHGLRGASADQDADFVSSLARQRGWGATVESASIRELAGRHGQSVEECGRHQRHDFFRRVLALLPAEVVATAHHADDNAETILHRFFRGTGLRGLAGIPPVRRLERAGPRRIIRPLLCVRRAELAAYLDQRGLTARTDASNEELQATRNRIRHQLIPLLESEYNPSVVPAILRLGQQCRWFREYADESADALLSRVVLARNDHCVTLSRPGLLQEPRILQAEVVRRALGLLGCGEKKLTFRHLQAVIDFAGRRASGKRLELPGGVLVTHQHDRLLLERP